MLKGKTALITGGSRGIGRAIALALAAEGADVAVIYNGGESAARAVCEEAAQQGVKAVAYACNVADADQVPTVTAAILTEFGGVDILVNNAGITRDGLLSSMSEEDFVRVMEVNLGGAFHFTKSLYGHFLKKRSGRIINISSVSGLMGNPGQANYAASKAGLIGFTKSVAKELAGRGITCNAVAPGFIQTEMTGALPREKQDAIRQQIPLRRFGTPEDVARVVLFLAGEAGGYITGEVIRVDGGLYI